MQPPVTIGEIYRVVIPFGGFLGVMSGETMVYDPSHHEFLAEDKLIVTCLDEETSWFVEAEGERCRLVVGYSFWGQVYYNMLDYF